MDAFGSEYEFQKREFEGYRAPSLAFFGLKNNPV